MQDNDIKITYIAIKDITPYKNNARKHGETDVAAIMKSIKEFGFLDPLAVWSDDNIVVEGHGRLVAAKKLGMKTVPCVRLDDLTDEQRRAYALAHNKTAELSIWDDDLLDIELGDITDIDMSQFGFDIKAAIEDTETVSETDSNFNYAEQYGVIVICENETEQEKIYNKLTEDGYNCRVVAV